MSRLIFELLSEAVQKKVFSCASYAVGTADALLERGDIGTLGIGRGPAERGTLYDLASVTKPLVALAFMRLMERGRVCLDDTVGDFLPAYRQSDKANITMRELLTHTSVLHGGVQLYRSCHTREDFLEAIRFLPARKNDTVEYSSQGMIVLGCVLEAIEQKPLDQIMQTELFDPLGMNNTLYNPPAALRDRIASTEDCPWRGRVLIGEVHDENAAVLGGVCAHAGLFSDAEDLTRVAQMMLTGRTPDGMRFLHDATRALMTQNHTRGMNLARGLGWQLKDKAASPAGDLLSENAYGHTGFTGTSIWMDPARDMFAVLLTNRVHPTREGEGIAHVRHVFHNLSVLSVEDYQAEK